LDGLTIWDGVAAGIGVLGLIFVAIDHFYFKPKRLKRQKYLDRLYKEQMYEVVKSIKGESK